jgi:hypothetical protein
MKSSWELALERTGGKLNQVSDEAKKAIASIEAKYKAKIAEAELSAQSHLEKADSQAKIDEIKEGLANEIASFKSKCEREKDAARKG